MKKKEVKAICVYGGQKILRSLSILFSISIICFVLMAFSPLDPLTQYLGGESSVLTNDRIVQISHNMGFDKSYTVRYFEWITDFLRGDMGMSFTYNRPVSTIIIERFLASVLLMIFAWVITGIMGFVLGILAAQNEGNLLDRIIKIYALTMASTPAYWVGILLVLIFSVKLQWFPVAFRSSIDSSSGIGDILHHIFLPAFTLSLSGVANIAFHTRQKLLEIYSTDYVLFAKARGENKWQILKRHGFKNLLIPVVTLQFGSIGEIFGGSVLVEKVFSYPGLGSAVLTSGIKGDIPLLLGVSLVSAVFVIVGNMLADIICQILDPRIKIGGTNAR